MIEIMPDADDYPWEWWRELAGEFPAPRHLPGAGRQHPARKETA